MGTKLNSPLLHIGDYFECFLNTFIGNFGALLEFGIVCISIEAEDVERVFRSDRYERTRP